MTTKEATLPYGYEHEEDVQKLNNGMTRGRVWLYEIEKEAKGRTAERLTRRVIYTAADYRVISGTQYEWHYQQGKGHMAVADGYRQFEIGELTRGGTAILEPEVAVVLAFTPEPGHLPAFIETLDPASLTTLLQELEAVSDDDRTLKAWMMPPIDAPSEAPSDVSETLSRMRQEMGLQVRRGRARAIVQAMRVAGVIVGKTGWALTPEEHKRRSEATAS